MCDTSDPNRRKLSQAHYIKRLQYLPLNADFKGYRSLRARLMWIVHMRPDIACAASFAAQVTQHNFSSESIELLNKIVRHVKNTPETKLEFHKLDINSLQLFVYCDSSFANLPDGKSQLDFIICLVDASLRCSVLHFSSRNQFESPDPLWQLRSWLLLMGLIMLC